MAGFCLSLGGRGGGVQTGPDVVGLWAAEAASLGEGVLSRRERRRLGEGEGERGWEYTS